MADGASERERLKARAHVLFSGNSGAHEAGLTGTDTPLAQTAVAEGPWHYVAGR